MFQWLYDYFHSDTRKCVIPSDINRMVTIYCNDNISFNDAAKLLYDVQNIGIIAGSSLAGILIKDTMFPKFVNNVGDIDIFVDTEEAFNRILKLLKPHGCKFSILNFEQDHLAKGISVAIASVPYFKVDLQIILFNKVSPSVQHHGLPKGLIHGFDMDFIQCSYFKGKLYTTKAFIEFLISGRSTKFNRAELPKGRRIYKAMLKGLSVPLYDNSGRSPKSALITYDELLIAPKKVLDTYMDAKTFARSIDMVHYSDLVVKSWSRTKKHAFNTSGQAYLYHTGRFNLKLHSDAGKETEYTVRSLCIPVEIIEYYPDRNRVLIKPNEYTEKLGGFKYLKLQCDYPGLGVYNAVIELYHSGGPNIWVTELLSTNTPVTLPRIDSNFTVS